MGCNVTMSWHSMACQPPCTPLRCVPYVGYCGAETRERNRCDSSLERWTCFSFQRAIDDPPFSRQSLGLPNRLIVPCSRAIDSKY